MHRMVMSTTCRIPGAVLTEREHVVPLVHSDPQCGRIGVFTHEVAAPDGGDRPDLVFLQVGPGFEAARPTSPPSGWMARAGLCGLASVVTSARGPSPACTSSQQTRMPVSP